MKILLDSVIIIDHLNNIEKATRYLAKSQDHKLYISVITRAEVLAGANRMDKGIIKAFLDKFEVISITCKDADRVADLRKEYKWKLPDAFQAALALNHRLKLATRNTKDFSVRKHDFVVVPYKIS